jgi:hypothetical protein
MAVTTVPRDQYDEIASDAGRELVDRIVFRSERERRSVIRDVIEIEWEARVRQSKDDHRIFTVLLLAVCAAFAGFTLVLVGIGWIRPL